MIQGLAVMRNSSAFSDRADQVKPTFRMTTTSQKNTTIPG
jgi:hypothetical protein